MIFVYVKRKYWNTVPNNESFGKYFIADRDPVDWVLVRFDLGSFLFRILSSETLLELYLYREWIGGDIGYHYWLEEDDEQIKS